MSEWVWIIGWVIVTEETWSVWRKPGLVPLGPPQIEGYRMAGRLNCFVLLGKCDSTAWWLERELDMVIPLDFFLLLTCSSWLMIANCAVLKINARKWRMLSGALWHLHPTCCLMYQKKSQCGQIRSGQLKTEIRWHCVLRYTLLSHLLGCHPSRSHYKGKYIAQNASLSWDPSAGLWVICCPCGWQILRKVICFGMWSAVIGQVHPDILKALCFLKLLGAACLMTVTRPGRLVSLDTTVRSSDPAAWIHSVCNWM